MGPRLPRRDALERIVGSRRPPFGRSRGRPRRRSLLARLDRDRRNDGRPRVWGFTTHGLGRTSAYVPDSLASAIQQNPSQKFDVIVEGVQKPRTRAAGQRGLKNGLLGARHGANTIGGMQIRRTFHAIDGLHAMLTGAQIAYLAKTPYVAAIVPNDTVELSSVAAAVLERPAVAVGGRRRRSTGRRRRQR